MEVVHSLINPGKFEVLFNGQARSCFDDTFCPGAGICAINQTWAAKPGGWCMCLTKFGLTGLNCNQWCAHAYALFFINLVGCFVGLVLAIIAAYFLVAMLRQPHSRSLTPVTLTLVFAFVGSLCFVIGPMLAMCTGIGFPAFYALYLDPSTGHTLKRSTQQLESATSTVFALAYCLSTCTIVVLPLTWIDIGRRSLHLKNSETSVVLGYSIVCVIVILLVELPFYVLISSRFRSEAAIWSLAIVIGWYFIYTSICLLNSFAFFSITRIKRSQSVNPIEVPDASAMSNFLRRIQLASGQLVIVSPVIMGLTTCFLYRSRRGFYSDPRCYWDSLDVAFRLTMWFVEYTCALALWFIAPTARSAMRSLVSQPAPNSISRLSSSLRPRFLGATTITLPTPIRSSEEASAVDKQDSHLLANKPEQATAILGQT